MVLHLRGGHQDGADALGKIFNPGGKRRHLHLPVAVGERIDDRERFCGKKTKLGFNRRQPSEAPRRVRVGNRAMSVRDETRT